jgi:hypothetical protein
MPERGLARVNRFRLGFGDAVRCHAAGAANRIRGVTCGDRIAPRAGNAARAGRSCNKLGRNNGAVI